MKSISSLISESSNISSEQLWFSIVERFDIKMSAEKLGKSLHSLWKEVFFYLLNEVSAFVQRNQANSAGTECSKSAGFMSYQPALRCCHCI